MSFIRVNYSVNTLSVCRNEVLPLCVPLLESENPNIRAAVLMVKKKNIRVDKRCRSSSIFRERANTNYFFACLSLSLFFPLHVPQYEFFHRKWPMQGLCELNANAAACRPVPSNYFEAMRSNKLPAKLISLMASRGRT